MEEKYWDSFEASGKIEDYLRYKGVQNLDGEASEGLNEVTKSEGRCNQGSTV